MTSPYRTRPPLPAAPRASWWRTLNRLRRAGRRLYWRERPPFLVFALWLVAWPLAYLLEGYLRLRRVRAAMRRPASTARVGFVSLRPWRIYAQHSGHCDECRGPGTCETGEALLDAWRRDVAERQGMARHETSGAKGAKRG